MPLIDPVCALRRLKITFTLLKETSSIQKQTARTLFYRRRYLRCDTACPKASLIAFLLLFQKLLQLFNTFPAWFSSFKCKKLPVVGTSTVNHRLSTIRLIDSKWSMNVLVSGTKYCGRTSITTRLFFVSRSSSSWNQKSSKLKNLRNSKRWTTI